MKFDPWNDPHLPAGSPLQLLAGGTALAMAVASVASVWVGAYYAVKWLVS